MGGGAACCRVPPPTVPPLGLLGHYWASPPCIILIIYELHCIVLCIIFPYAPLTAMHQVLRPPTELNAIILSSQSSHSLLPGAGIISMPFNSIIITRYTGHVVHFPPGNIIGLRIFSKIILWRQNYHPIILQDIAHARLDCYPPRYQRWQDYPTCVYSKHCTFFDNVLIH